MSKRFYIIFVSREADGRLKKIPVPLHYAYVFVAAAVVGAFTMAGLAGSYTRMLLKTENFNQVRTERESIRKNYLHMEKVVHEKDIQAASLGSLASEVAALYGLRQSKLASAKGMAASADGASTSLAAGNFSDQQYHRSIDQFYLLRTSALSGRVAHALEAGLNVTAGSEDWIRLADAPSLWPVEGPVTSSFGERQDPFNGEGTFHAGIDISASVGQPIRASADGTVALASMMGGYGREIVIDHGYDVHTIYGHLSGFTVIAGEQVTRGQVIGYVGSSGRSTGPHLHYEVRIHNIPVNPHRFLRQTINEIAANDPGGPRAAGGN